jgi:hypothetical protein
MVIVFEGYGRIKCSFNPNASSRAATQIVKNDVRSDEVVCPKARQAVAGVIFLKISNF